MKRGTNPKSLENLRAHAIKPGEVRNPEGINRGKRPFSDLYYTIGQEVLPENERAKLNREVGLTLHRKGVTRIEASVRGLFHLAATGDAEAIRELANRLEGRPPQRLEISATPEKIQTMLIVRYEDRRGNRHDSLEVMRQEDAKPSLEN